MDSAAPCDPALLNRLTARCHLSEPLGFSVRETAQLSCEMRLFGNTSYGCILVVFVASLRTGGSALARLHTFVRFRMRAELAMTAVIIPFPRHRTELNGFSPDDITELRRWASLVGPRGLRLLTALDPMSRTESIVARLSDGTELASVTTEEGSEASSFDILRSRGQWILKPWQGGEMIFAALRDALEYISPTVVVRSPSSAS